jgi:hypothetical protein
MEMADSKYKMRALLYDLGILVKEACTEEENEQLSFMEEQGEKLPEDVHKYAQPNTYYRLVKSNMTEDEITRVIMLKQTQYLRTIKNCLVFFVALTIISFFWAFFIIPR